MNEEQLREIEERQDKARQDAYWYGGKKAFDAIAYDIPALIAEVRRLQEELRKWQEAYDNDV